MSLYHLAIFYLSFLVTAQITLPSVTSQECANDCVGLLNYYNCLSYDYNCICNVLYEDLTTQCIDCLDNLDIYIANDLVEALDLCIEDGYGNIPEQYSGTTFATQSGFAGPSPTGITPLALPESRKSSKKRLSGGAVGGIVGGVVGGVLLIVAGAVAIWKSRKRQNATAPPPCEKNKYPPADGGDFEEEKSTSSEVVRQAPPNYETGHHTVDNDIQGARTRYEP